MIYAQQLNNIQLTSNTYDQSETSATVNPLDSNDVICVWNDFRYGTFSKPGYAYSTDGGNTWNDSVFSSSGSYTYGFDPSVSFDKNGNAFYCHGTANVIGTESQVFNNTISNSNIYHGILIDGGADVDCINNSITKNSPNTGRGDGILYGGGTSGTAAQNDISGWDWGIGAIWGADIDSYFASYPGKNNRIRYCNAGIEIYRNSYGDFGIPTPGDSYGDNSIYGNSVNVAVGTLYPT